VNKPKIVLLAGGGLSSNIIFHSINDNFGIHAVIQEEKESAAVFLKRRIKKIGLITTIGQILFQLLVAKPLYARSRKRIEQILAENRLNTKKIDEKKLKRVKSINSEETIELLKGINPDLVIVNGTRIISKQVISSINCEFINTHAGITPKYRGVHGAYWALANGDVANCGVTAHFIDEGIDTGDIIRQSTIKIDDSDNFATYPFLQLAEGVKLLNAAVKAFFENNITAQKAKGESHLWYHPTIWRYIYNRLKKKVK
jgi:methionyl-tRNA formyltransferase